MTTTTSYGTWNNRVDSYGINLQTSAIEAFGSEGPDGFDFDAIVSDYRTAINDALPDSVSLCGDEFIGPYYEADCDFDGYPTDEGGRLDIKAIVESIDFWEIAAKHENA
ncbi:hypothetical protein [Streptosporangium roseum]|uniref:hypothetical protein n=1 Tax=Streptosporangium roseum TaxID=2001 RepID=UPI0004CD663B|nr:hypothetical protein [Streptosporangium roseum]